MSKRRRRIIIILISFCFVGLLLFIAKNSLITMFNFSFEQRELGEAIIAEDIDNLNVLIKKGFSPDLINKKGESLLMYAIKNNKPEAIKSIIKNGANINMVVDEMHSAIEAAIKLKNNKLLELIIGLGGDVNLLHSQSSRPLNYAFYYKNLEAVEILIKNKADINLPDTFGNSVFTNLIFIKDFKSALKLLTFVRGDINNPINSLPRVKHKIVGYLELCNRERHFKDKDYLNLVNELKKLGFQFKNN
jgi:ankyrin repeat protein